MGDVTRIVLSHQSALAYWSIPEVHMPSAYLTVEQERDALTSAVGSLGTLELGQLLAKRELVRFPRPLDLLTSSRPAHRKSDAVCFHTLQGSMPEHAIVKTQFAPIILECGKAIELCVTSPELTYIQMANLMSELDLLRLGFELCGSYSLAGGADGGFVSHGAVTSAADLARFAQETQRVHGVTAARMTASHVLDGSNSPRESDIALLMTLPRHRGGLAMDPPVLNQTLVVPPHLMAALGYDRITPDYRWPGPRVVLEYNSRMFHSFDEKNEDDARRNNTYVLMGESPFSMTRGQFAEFGVTKRILVGIAREVDASFRDQTPFEIELMRALHEELLHGERFERFEDPWQITYR